MQKNNSITNNNNIYKGIYKIEPYTMTNHPEYNDNDNFVVLNFTFNHNNTLYKFSFVKLLQYDGSWVILISCICLIIVALIYIYFSTYMKLNFQFIKDIRETTDEIKWYHILFGVFFASSLLLLIYLFRKYMIIILNILIGFESWLCTYYATLFFVLEIGQKMLSQGQHKKLKNKKIELLCYMNTYEILSAFLSAFIIMLYFMTRHYLINDIICFCLSFTVMSFIVLKSFILCFMCLFAFFIYDTFWVFYSDKIFHDNIMLVAATSIQIPIKIEFPILFSDNPLKNCMILGLGDILLPGLIIKYSRRFDCFRARLNHKIKGMSFYTFNLILYLISLATAMICMKVFNHGQPVLFYLSPIFIFGLIGKAYNEGCLTDFWNGLKIKKNKNKMKAQKGENEDNKEGQSEEEEDEDDEKNIGNNNKFIKDKTETELQKLNLD